MVNGYDLGADDYITKPFSLMLLISKVNALMRRISDSNMLTLVSSDISVSLQEMKAYKKEEPLQLSKKELQLLILLMEHGGQILSKEQILEHIWNCDGQFIDDNTVSVNISRLKSKLGNGYIENVRGMGYIWVKESIKE